MFQASLFSLFWGIIIFLSLTGWGWVMIYLLRLQKNSGWGFKASLGLSFSLVCGGLMNLLSIISPKTILIYLGLGIVLLLFFIINKFRDIAGNFVELLNEFKKDKVFALLFAGIFLLLAYQYSVAAFSASNPLDDYQAYFVYPGEMLETGSMGNNPFSDRRLTGALGGQSFLDTFVLAVLPYDYLNLVDRGVSWIILILLIWELFKKFNSSRRTAALAIGSLMLFYSQFCNITGQATATVVLLVLGQLFFGEKLERASFWRRSMFISLIAAALASIKSNMIIACFFYIIFYYSLSYKESGTREDKIAVIKSLIFSALAIFSLLLPWMILMYHSSGTLLYPILGKGFHGSVYGTYAVPYSRLTFANLLTLLYNLANVVFIVLFLLILFIRRSVPHNDGLRRRLKLIIWATLLSVATCAFLVAGLSVHYYTYPIVVTAVILLLANFAGEGDNFRGYLTSWKYEQVALIITAIIFGAGLSVFLPGIKGNLSLIHTHLSDKQSVFVNSFLNGKRVSGDFSSTAEERASYQKMQEAIPPGKIVLARTEKPFLFDFKRNIV